MSARWGDLPGPSEASHSMSGVDVELPFANPQPIEIEGPRLHQPSQQHKPSVTQIPAELCRTDPISIHTIQLLKHNRRLRSMIAVAQQHQQDHRSEDRELPRLPTLPTLPQTTKPMKPWDSTERLQLDTIELDEITVRQITRRSVATICAHSGFENCQESVLETLTDVLGDYNQKISKLLRVAVDREARTSTTGFQDVLQHVFHEVGISRFKNLEVFWETRIRDYHKVVQQRALQLRQEYDKYRHPKHRGMEDSIVKVKEEPLSEIHFPLGDSDNPESTENLLDLHGIGMHLEDSSCSSNVTESDSSHWALTYIKTEGQDRVSALDSLSESIPVEQQDYPGPPSTSQSEDRERRESGKTTDNMSPLNNGQ